MTTQWNPYAYQQTSAPAGRRLPLNGPDARWWVAPSVCTLALVLSAWFDLSVLSGFGSPSEMIVLCYALPVVLVAVSWLLPHRRSLRGARIGLGASGVGMALMISKVLAMGVMILIMCLFLLFGGSYEG